MRKLYTWLWIFYRLKYSIAGSSPNTRSQNYVVARYSELQTMRTPFFFCNALRWFYVPFWFFFGAWFHETERENPRQSSCQPEISGRQNRKLFFFPFRCEDRCSITFCRVHLSSRPLFAEWRLNSELQNESWKCFSPHSSTSTRAEYFTLSSRPI